jgi:hypothetical protein
LAGELVTEDHDVMAVDSDRRAPAVRAVALTGVAQAASLSARRASSGGGPGDDQAETSVAPSSAGAEEGAMSRSSIRAGAAAGVSPMTRRD